MRSKYRSLKVKMQITCSYITKAIEEVLLEHVLILNHQFRMTPRMIREYLQQSPE